MTSSVADRACQRLDAHEEKLTTAISFATVAAVFILTAYLHLGMLLMAAFFSYFALQKLSFGEPKRKWPAILCFLVLLSGAAYGLAFFLQATAAALPGIAEKAMPAVTQWADTHHIRLPFTDLDSLKDEAMKLATSEAKNIGKFADIARGATTEFIYLIVGCVVAIGLFLSPRSKEPETDEPEPNFYSVCRDKVRCRFAKLYDSFSLIMSAQVIISSIDATLTGIFVGVLGLPYLLVAVGVTFICGLVPMVGNLLSNTLVVGLGFMVSPTKGLGALAFLVFVHQMEYFLNGRIVGTKIRTRLWATFLALVAGEGLMGITGLILAPAVLHYIREEAASFPARSRQHKKSGATRGTHANGWHHRH